MLTLLSLEDGGYKIVCDDFIKAATLILPRLQTNLSIIIFFKYFCNAGIWLGFGFGSIVTFSFVCKLLLKSLASGVCKILKLGDVHRLRQVKDLILYVQLVSEFKPTIV